MQSTQIAEIQTVNTVQSTQIAEIQTVNTVQSTQIGTLNTQVAAITTNIAAMQSDIGTLFDLRREDRRDMRQGVASGGRDRECANALGARAVSYAVNGAAFRGEYAVGGSMMYRLNTYRRWPSASASVRR